ncbi:MAG: transporter substrate-binding domain-containing protein [Firmicutes bacterium]|nr:transporter substrate-binding domain-containing protein [Bacillota bacterium]
MKRRITCLLTVILVIAEILPQQEVYALTTTVRVGFCDQMPPYQYTDEQGTPHGFHVDVLESIAEEEDLLLEYHTYNTTFEAMDELEAGNVDLVLGCVDGRYPGYSIRYSNPVSTTNLCLITTSTLASKYREEKTGYRRMAAEFNLCDFTFLYSLTKGSVQLEQNQISTIEGLAEGQVEMIVVIKDCLLWYLQEHETEDDYVILNNYLASADFTIAVREGDRHLYEAVNNSLVSLRTSGEYEDLYTSWIAKDKSVDYQKLLKTVLYIAGIALIFLAAYLIVSYRAKKKLARLVEVRTSELYEANQKLERRTAQVEAENRLRYSIIEASPAGMVLVDENMNIEYMNNSALQIAGLHSYLSGKPAENLRILREILRDAGGKIFTADWEYTSGSFAFYRDKARHIKETYRYSIHKMTLYEESKGALITLENVTAEEKEREATFEKEKNETLNSIIAGIAHEIKNPLTTISASAAMIETKGNNEKFRKAFSTYIPQEIERITRLINNLIDYARPSGSQIELLSLHEILPSVVELAKVTAKNTEFVVTMNPRDSLQFTGDRDKMKQALLNIVINSIEATRQKQEDIQHRHEIIIEAYRMENAVVIKVTDDGIGMSASQLNRCMNPFYTTKPAGTGIGLALTKQYVEEVGGKITITSQKNIFTSVEIQLPAAGGKEEIK